MEKATTGPVVGTDSLTLQTVKAQWKDPPAPASQSALLVQIYPTGQSIGSRHPLGDTPLDIGRGDKCHVRITHNSVSRHHARIKWVASGFCVQDLESTNGTFVNDVQVSESTLRDGDYLRVGTCIFRFLAGSNLEAEYHEEIYRLAIFDALTEAHNKRYLLEFLQKELARSVRHHRVLSVVFFDIDHFKRVNDNYGHLCGDHILREMSARIRKTLRKEELFARYGGEEFATVLPETAQESASAFAERLRQLVATEPFVFDGESLQVTISLGIAATVEGRPEMAEELLRRADEALYRAKGAGRNCSRVAAPPEDAANQEQPI